MFDDKSWTRVRNAANIRLLLKTDIYRDVTTEINLLQNCPGTAAYHSMPCYKNYTAVKRPNSQNTEEPSAKKPDTRRRSGIPKDDSRGIIAAICIFCGKSRKIIKQKEEALSQCLTEDGCARVMASAAKSTNQRIKGLCGLHDEGNRLIAKEAHYHKSCRRDYFKEAERLQQETEERDQATSRQIHAETFESISAFITTEVIENGQAILATSLLSMYKAEYIGNGGKNEDIRSYGSQALMRKVQDKFAKKISIVLFNHHKGNFLYSSALSESAARSSLLNDKDERQSTLRNAALHLRKEILQMAKWETPYPTSVETLKTCSPDLPDDLMLFFRTLLCGLRKPNANNDSVDRKAMAMSSDAAYNVSRGAVRPWKQTVLGLGIGTLTGSKLILRILNRMGYSLSYDEVKALETEFAYTTDETDHYAPDGIKLKPDLGTGLAWDNYDVNMETLDGKDTLHATVGICYQNTTDGDKNRYQELATRSGRNRRQFDGQEREIATMHQLLSRARFHVPAPDQPTENAAIMTLTQRMVDFYWLQLSQQLTQPLFVGFFSQFVQDNLPKHKICYMDPIPASPTKNNVVKETMKRTMNVACETNQEYAVVTYDLAVALKAYSIQFLEAPIFDRLLIMLGNFHLELAFYGAIGTYINESGAEHLLTECDVLAENSLNGFIRGKYYNRCSRIHQILALAMEQKLYNSFWKTLSQEQQDAMTIWMNDVPRESNEIEEYLQQSSIFHDHKDQYEQFFTSVMEGSMGPTAQYWCGYIYLINRVHRDLLRAVRTNDIEGYIAILPTIIDVFFGLNRPNYARWGVLFLTKLQEVDPRIRGVLEKGAFSIRRTSQSFARTAVDLTLEQTVNRDAASPMKGIVGFHNAPNAIRRWCVTSTQRGMSVTELRRMTGLLPEEQPRTQLRASRIKKDNRQLKALLTAISESCNPFSDPATTSSTLLNIATGKAASPATHEYLTESLKTGHDLHIKFKEECAKDDTRFHKTIKRRNVENFAKENTKSKPSASSKVTPVVNSQRDKFIRMLVVISQNTNFDLKHVVSYPITDVPLSISQPDGSRLKTNKSTLLKKLESMQEVTSLPHIDVTLIDGGLLLHSYLSAIGSISSYGNLARAVLGHVFAKIARGQEVHILFDRYLPGSLKESERRLRGGEDTPFVIGGCEQRPKQSCKKLLENGIFKDQLAKFFMTEWQKEHYGPVLGKKSLFVSHGGTCLRIEFNEINNKMSIVQPENLQGTHEEADTLLAYHAATASGNLLVRASDTDVMVIIIGMLGRNMMAGTPVKSIFMDCGSGNSRRFIDITSIAKALETKQDHLAAALPGLHAFSGCDYTAAFHRKGKIRPYQVLENDNDGNLIEFFCSMSSKGELDVKMAEVYVNSLYGMENYQDVNQARFNRVVQMTGKIDKVGKCHLT